MEWISHQNNFFAKNIYWRRLSMTSLAMKKINFHQYAAVGLGDLRHCHTINGHESGEKPRTGTQQLVNEFYQLAAKNLNVNAVQRSIASVI